MTIEHTTIIRNVCHAGSVSYTVRNDSVGVPAGTRVLLELPEAWGEAMTKETDTKRKVKLE
jgi:hypothetical protein